jgi:large subunit ribosomal protein L30
MSAARLRIEQTRSEIGGTQGQRATLRSLGLRGIGDVVEKDDRPEFRGMVRTVAHLVQVTELAQDDRTEA